MTPAIVPTVFALGLTYFGVRSLKDRNYLKGLGLIGFALLIGGLPWFGILQSRY